MAGAPPSPVALAPDHHRRRPAPPPGGAPPSPVALTPHLRRRPRRPPSTGRELLRHHEGRKRSLMARGSKPCRDWSTGLPLELLRLVLLHLPCRRDRVYFACVCRAWRSAAKDEAPPRQLPWLVMPSPGTASFFTQQTGRTYHLSLPEGIRSARLCGSHEGGWVAAAGEAWGGYAAVNIFSGVNVPLPSRISFFHPFTVRGNGCRCNHPMLLRMVTFSAAPTSANCIAAAHIASVSNIAFCRPGMDAHWLTLSQEPRAIEDIIYCRSLALQGFYALRDTEDLVVYAAANEVVISNKNTTLVMSFVHHRFEKRVDYSLNKPVSSVSRYLVESRGKLLMVLREHSVRAMKRCTRVFRIFEMAEALPHSQAKASWVELHELQGRALFLGRGSSRAVEVSQFTGLQEGVIYYFDDACFDISLVVGSGGKFSSSDMGVYSMAMKKRLTRGEAGRFPRQFASECSPPLWLLN